MAGTVCAAGSYPIGMRTGSEPATDSASTSSVYPRDPIICAGCGSGSWVQWCLAECCLAEWCLAECCLAEWCLAEWCLAECCLAECCLAECCLAQCCLAQCCLAQCCLAAGQVVRDKPAAAITSWKLLSVGLSVGLWVGTRRRLTGELPVKATPSHSHPTQPPHTATSLHLILLPLLLLFTAYCCPFLPTTAHYSPPSLKLCSSGLVSTHAMLCVALRPIANQDRNPISIPSPSLPAIPPHVSVCFLSILAIPQPMYPALGSRPWIPPLHPALTSRPWIPPLDPALGIPPLDPGLASRPWIPPLDPGLAIRPWIPPLHPALASHRFSYLNGCLRDELIRAGFDPSDAEHAQELEGIRQSAHRCGEPNPNPTQSQSHPIPIPPNPNPTQSQSHPIPIPPLSSFSTSISIPIPIISLLHRPLLHLQI